MTRSQINIGFVVRITPDVVTDGRVHVLARRVQVFLVALDLVDECRLGDGNSYIVLLSTEFRRRWRRLSSQRADVADCALPKFAMGCAGAFAQLGNFFVGDVDARMDTHELRTKSRRTLSH